MSVRSHEFAHRSSGKGVVVAIETEAAVGASCAIRSRRSSYVATLRRAEGTMGCSAAKRSVPAGVSECGDSITALVVQAVLDKDSEGCDRVLPCLDPNAVKKVDGDSKPGDVNDRLTSSLGLGFSEDGKRFFRTLEPGVVLKWREPEAVNPRTTKPARDTVLGLTCWP